MVLTIILHPCKSFWDLPCPKYHMCEFSHYLQSQKITFSTITLKGSILRYMFLHNSYIHVLVAVILHLSRSLKHIPIKILEKSVNMKNEKYA